jgi:hypothetical protein
MDESITAELLQELQGVNHLQHELERTTDGGNNAIVTAATRKKKKGQSPEDADSAVRVREVARALSKKNQKRVEQIRKRKVIEMKLVDYLGVINSHQITDTQRALLTSSKQVGQSLSLKQLISNIYHKEQYGLPISVEERELLYHNRNNAADSAVSDISAADATSSAYNADSTDLTSSHSMIDKISTSKAVSGDLLFSFDDIFEKRSVTTTADPILTITINSKAGSNRKRKKTSRMPQGGESDGVASDADNAHQSVSAASELPAPQPMSSSAADGPVQQPTVAGVKSSTVGAGLLSQLMKIKESAASRAQTASETQSSLLEVEVDNDHRHLPTTGKYIVQETAAPVSDRGEIIIHGLQEDSIETREQQAPVEAARFVRLQRSVGVQAARMQLPICAMEQEIVEAIRSDMHDALVLCGETGSGKSTQVAGCCIDAMLWLVSWLIDSPMWYHVHIFRV